MAQVANLAYVLLWEELSEYVKSDRMVAVTLKAQGFTNADKSPIEIPDLREARREFDANLVRPLNYERQRAALMKAVTS